MHIVVRMSIMSHVAITSHIINMMITIMKISEADTNPPKKRPIDKKDGDVSEIVGASLSSASCTSSWTPLTVIVVFSVDVS